eukprot:gene9293-biopygen2161
MRHLSKDFREGGCLSDRDVVHRSLLRHYPSPAVGVLEGTQLHSTILPRDNNKMRELGDRHDIRGESYIHVPTATPPRCAAPYTAAKGRLTTTIDCLQQGRRIRPGSPPRTGWSRARGEDNGHNVHHASW